jgi:hypothetical protein
MWIQHQSLKKTKRYARTAERKINTWITRCDKRSLGFGVPTWIMHNRKNDPDLCRNTMKYRNTHKRRYAVEVELHFINNK